METLLDLQEIAWHLATAETVEERLALSRLLRETQTEIDSKSEPTT